MLNLMSTRKAALVGLTALSALVAVPASAALVSVDFGTATTLFDEVPSPVYSGPEATATAAHSGFGAANVWNAIRLPEYVNDPIANPSFGGLLDSTGAATGIGLSLTGAVKGFSGFNNPDPARDPLRSDYLFLNSVNNEATTLSWQITGLVAGASYGLFLYGSDAGNNDYRMNVAGMEQTISGRSGTAYFASLVADSDGHIGGSLLPGGFDEEANWSGFQLLALAAAPPVVEVPEPASALLFGSALLALLGARRRS